MLQDTEYMGVSGNNMGSSLEDIITSRMEFIFGESRVYSNVEIFEDDSKREILGEIDVLVVYEGNALVIQAKQKKMTLEARRGSAAHLSDDFRKAIQHPYNQAFDCSNFILRGCKLYCNGKEISLGTKRTKITPYPICVLSDNYPSIILQTQAFLDVKESSVIRKPLVLDIFSLLVIVEFLRLPDFFLRYITFRTRDNFFMGNGEFQF